MYLIFVLWEFYDKYYNDPHLVEPDWQFYWLHEGFEDMLFFTILAAIMVLWRPNLNNARLGCTTWSRPLTDDVADTHIQRLKTSLRTTRSTTPCHISVCPFSIDVTHM